MNIIKLLRETFIPEAEVEEHATDRIKGRMLSMSNDDLPKDIKEQILTNFSKVEGIDFPKKKSYVIFLGQIPINKNSEYYVEFRGKDYYQIGKSIGNQFWVIIRNNTIGTFMLATDQQTRNPERNADRLNVDMSIKNLDRFIHQLNQSRREREKQPIVSINGVKWIVDTNNEIIFKKNKPSIKHKVIDMIDSVDSTTQEKIMDFF